MPEIEGNEFARIKLALIEAKNRWEVIREGCPVRVKGRAFPAFQLSRCAGVIENLKGGVNVYMR